MKKVVAFLVIAVVLVTAFACSADYKNNEKDFFGDKVYKIAVDSSCPPFSVKNEKGEIYGVAIDLFEELAEVYNMSFEIVDMSRDEAYKAISDESADMYISGVKITDDNKKVFDFTGPYIQSGLVMFTRTDNKKIESETDLNTDEYASELNKVAVCKNTDASEYAGSLGGRFVVVEFDSVQEVLDAVVDGRCIAGFEESICVEYAAMNDMPVKIVGSEKQVRSYAFALKKGTDEEFVEKLDLGLRSIINSGKYEDILKNYLVE